MSLNLSSTKKQKLPTSPPLPKETNKEKLLDFTSHHHHVTNPINFLPPAKNKTPPKKKPQRKTFREIGLSFPSSCDKFHQLPPQPLSKTPQKISQRKTLRQGARLQLQSCETTHQQ
jgi:hypothetical protein